MVSISTKGYNVAKVGVNGVIDVDTLTVVGSKKDYLRIFEFAQTGYLILRCKFKKSGVTLLFDGSVDCVISENESEIFFSTITEGDGAYQTLAGKFVLSSDKCKFTISEDELGGGITVDSAMSDLSENPVQNKVIKGALDDITELIPSDASTSNKLATKADVDKGYVEVTADGVKAWSNLFVELYALIDKSKVSVNSVLSLDDKIFRVHQIRSSDIFYTRSSASSSSQSIETISIGGSAQTTYYSAYTTTTPTYSNKKNDVPTSGKVVRLYY